MNLKEAYTYIEQLPNGGEIVAFLKEDNARLNGEAKRNRENSESLGKKLAELFDAAGLQDDADALTNIKSMRDNLAQYKQSGEPSEIAREIARMSAEIGNITKQLNEANAAKEAEKAKRHTALKQNAIIDALSKGNAASPAQMAQMLANCVKVDENDNLTYTTESGESVSVADGVAEWLNANTWAVKTNSNAGGGANGASGRPINDAFLAGFLGE